MKLTETDNIKVLDVTDTKWDEIVRSFLNYDVYYLSGYVKAFQIHGDGTPLLIHYENCGLRAIYVFMLRQLEDGLYDIITPYGYGGVLFQGEIFPGSLESFRREWHHFAHTNRIVDNFIRFHPILGNAELNRPLCNVVDLGQTIAMDLSSPEIIWTNIISKNRNVIRKAEKNGVIIKHGKGMELLDRFMAIYNKTMEHDNAASYYFFEREFYESIDKDLCDNHEVFYAEYEGKIISMAIMIFANHMMSYHLSGSVYEYRWLAPSNLLLYTAALWGYEQGFKSFHLGGGIGSGRDALYKFKEAFNRNSGLQFSIGKEIFDKAKYNELVDQRAEKDNSFNPDSQFFPLYRS